MFEDVYDSISKIFSSRWPNCEGEITAIDVDVVPRHEQRGSAEGLRLAVAYKFSLGEDGPYTGEYFWDPGSAESVLDAKEQLKVGQSATVRYRRDKPSVSTLDTQSW